MKIAFYKGNGGVFDKIVRICTNSIYSHCELYISGECWSSSILDGGVRSKRIDIYSDSWDLVDVPCKYDATKALQWFISKSGSRYDILGALHFILPLIPQSKNKYFCSEAIAEALGIDNSQGLTPQDLYNMFK